jgi:hypothetical protein
MVGIWAGSFGIISRPLQIVEYTVGANANDTNTNYSTWNDGDDCWAGKWASAVLGVSLRWTGVTIPVGSIVKTSYIIVTAYGYDNAKGSANIYFNDALAPVAPTDATTFAAKVLTTASVPWSPTDWVQSSTYNSPDISAVLNELIASYDYSAGSAMQAMLIGSSSGINDDFNIGTKNRSLPAILHIEYI